MTDLRWNHDDHDDFSFLVRGPFEAEGPADFPLLRVLLTE